MQDADKKKLSDSIQLLSTAFNKGEHDPIIKAVDILQSIAHTESKIVTVRADKVSKEDAVYLSTGTVWLDDWLSGGIRKPELVLFGAPPFGGKTHLQVWFVGNLLLTYPKAQAAHFIGEDIITDVRNMYKRILPASALKRVWFVDMVDYRFSVHEVEAGVNKLRKEGVEIDIVVADHVDIMTPGHYSFSEQGGLTSIVRDLRVMTKRLDVVGVTASQSYPKSGERKGLARLFGAKIGKAGNADVVIIAEPAFGRTIKLSLDKARGRAIPADATKQVVVDWSNMRVDEV